PLVNNDTGIASRCITRISTLQRYHQLLLELELAARVRRRYGYGAKPERRVEGEEKEAERGEKYE
uniref:Uncharacterized protein n=1 Tax=Oryza brachyantha TaxID=4533 RepID=J3LY25_ORYBR